MEINENIRLTEFTESFVTKYAKAYGNIFKIKGVYVCHGCGDEIVQLYGVSHGDAYSRCRFCHTLLNGTCYSTTRFESIKQK